MEFSAVFVQTHVPATRPSPVAVRSFIYTNGKQYDYETPRYAYSLLLTLAFA